MRELATFEIETYGVLLKMPAAEAGQKCNGFFALAAASQALEYKASWRNKLLEDFF